MGLREIVRQDWISLLDAFSRDFAGRHARLEVVGKNGAQHVITEDLPFEGMNADLKDGEHSVSITLGQGETGPNLTHTVSDVTSVSVDELNGRVARVEIGSADQSTTVFTLH
jgi:hypothetical protein